MLPKKALKNNTKFMSHVTDTVIHIEILINAKLLPPQSSTCRNKKTLDSEKKIVTSASIININANYIPK